MQNSRDFRAYDAGIIASDGPNQPRINDTNIIDKPMHQLINLEPRDCQRDPGNGAVSCSDPPESIKYDPSNAAEAKLKIPSFSISLDISIPTSTSQPPQTTQAPPPSSAPSSVPLAPSSITSVTSSIDDVVSISTQTQQAPTSTTFSPGGQLATANTSVPMSEKTQSSHSNHTSVIIGVSVSLIVPLLVLLVLLVVLIRRKGWCSKRKKPQQPKDTNHNLHDDKNPLISYPKLSQAHLPSHYANDLGMTTRTENVSGYPRPAFLERLRPRQKVARESGRVPALSSHYPSDPASSTSTRFTPRLGTGQYRLPLHEIPSLPELRDEDTPRPNPETDSSPPTLATRRKLRDRAGESWKPQQTPTTVGTGLTSFWSQGADDGARSSHGMTEKSRIIGMYAEDSPGRSARDSKALGLAAIGEGMEMKILKGPQEYPQVLDHAAGDGKQGHRGRRLGSWFK